MTHPSSKLNKIIESDSILSILDHVNEDTFVFSDLDNTLIESENHLGSAQWGDYLYDLYFDPNRPVEDADSLEAEKWCEVQPLINIRHVDPQTPELIRRLHENKIPLIGLTARRPEEIHFTLEQLNSLQITLSRHFFNNDYLDDASQPRKRIIFHHGVIYCTPINQKSYGLKLFLEKAKCNPKKIIFIDDKLSHVEDVALFAKEQGIDYVGIRFSGADPRVKTFCPNIVKVQYEHLPKILSNDEAKFIFESKNNNK
ncbi:MAG: DUF2608 domain-containing protein [Parachlamydiaceae bacterium]|nr:DUF2608 domain-containing protein [Parachlamydiaceae bacterium]